MTRRKKYRAHISQKQLAFLAQLIREPQLRTACDRELRPRLTKDLIRIRMLVEEKEAPA